MRVLVLESGHMRVRRTHMAEIRHRFTHLAGIRHQGVVGRGARGREERGERGAGEKNRGREGHAQARRTRSCGFVLRAQTPPVPPAEVWSHEHAFATTAVRYYYQHDPFELCLPCRSSEGPRFVRAHEAAPATAESVVRPDGERHGGAP